MRLGILVVPLFACRTEPSDPAGDDDDDDDTVVDTATEVGGGNDVPLDAFPPVVLSTVPPSGTLGVDSALDRIEIVFSRPMSDNSWSWVNWEGYAFPALGTVLFEGDALHVADGVALDDDTAYLAWLNSLSGTYAAFTDRSGEPALPFPLAFATGEATLDGFPPAVIGVDPAPGAEGVDPALDRITVTFSRDMDVERFGWRADRPSTAPAVRGERFDGPRTAILDVELAPGTTYAVWLNDPLDGFFSADGVAAAPYLVSFRTGP